MRRLCPINRLTFFFLSLSLSLRLFFFLWLPRWVLGFLPSLCRDAFFSQTTVRREEPVGVAGDVRVRALPADEIPERQDAIVSELRTVQGSHAAILAGLRRLRPPAVPRSAPEGSQLDGARQNVSRKSAGGGRAGERRCPVVLTMIVFWCFGVARVCFLACSHRGLCVGACVRFCALFGV